MTAMAPELFAAAARMCCDFIEPRGAYAPAHGSHAAGRAGPHSDLDPVLVADALGALRRHLKYWAIRFDSR